MSEPCGMEEERDHRFRRLSTVGTVFNFVAVVLALTAVASYHWATLEGPILGYMGPFIVCQDIPGGLDRCEKGGLGPYKQTVASYAAGVCAIVATIGLAIGLVLAPLIVAMHHAQHAICIKFRQAILARLIATSSAAFSSLIACICFFLEAKIFLKMQNDDSADLGWSFYVEALTFVLAVGVGIGSSYEWQLSRKLGGDPTIYARDPEGVKADTIVNPNFRDAPRPGNPSGKNASRKGGTGRSGGVHRNANGVAMTAISGLPYSITNGGSRGGMMNGHAANGRSTVVAFDPKKTPLRSSLRRPKSGGAKGVQLPRDDIADSPTSGVVHNPTFAATSPTQKKKVRIHTQSTAV